MRRIRRSAKGQGTIELLLMLTFLSLLLLGFVQLSLFAATKSMVDLAAFSAARTVLVTGWRPSPIPVPGGTLQVFIGDLARIQVGWPAAWQVLDNLHWWPDDMKDAPDFPLRLTSACPDGRVSLLCPGGRKALSVTYRVPLGRPLFDSSSSEGLPVKAASPFVVQHESGNPSADIPEEGDNADP